MTTPHRLHASGALEGELIPADDESETDDENDEGSSGELTLVFTSTGQVVLEEDSEDVWFSDDDDDFQVEFGKEFLDADEDAGRILNWLVEEGWIDEDEKGNVGVETEVDDESDNENEF